MLSGACPCLGELGGSQDLDELIEVSTTIAVLNGGQLSEPQPTREVSREQLGLLMGGAQGMQAARAGSNAAA